MEEGFLELARGAEVTHYPCRAGNRERLLIDRIGGIMRKYLLVFIAFAMVGTVQAETLFPDVVGEALIDSLQMYYTPDPAIDVLDYGECRDTAYALIDNHDNIVEDVYSGYQAAFDPSTDGDPTSYLFENEQINAEHTWPRSLFDEEDPLESDLHHLFPCWEVANSGRSNLQFGYVEDAAAKKWYYNKDSTSSTPSEEMKPLYSRGNSTKFEVRDSHKGNTARAVFYMWAIYQDHSAMMQNDNGAENQAFFDGMKDDLLVWHRSDPPDSLEIVRSEMIEVYQGNQNPFVLDTSLVARAFFMTSSVEDGQTAGSLPQRFEISGVYPNPFNPSTNVVIGVPEAMQVRAEVFNMLGQRISTLADDRFNAGYHTLVFDGSNVSSGVYLLRVSSGSGMQAVRRITLVR